MPVTVVGKRTKEKDGYVALIVGLAYLMNYSGLAYTLGLGVAANAQPVLASHVASSTGHPSTHQGWEVYGPYASLRACVRAQREFAGRDSHCEIQSLYRHHREYYVWYLYVLRSGRM